MATMTNEQIEAKKLRLKQLADEAALLKNELVEAGAWPLEEEDLDNVTGGGSNLQKQKIDTIKNSPQRRILR